MTASRPPVAAAPAVGGLRPPASDALRNRPAHERGRLRSWTGQFADPALEREYRNALWSEDSGRNRVIVVASAVFMLVLGVADYVTLGAGAAFAACLTLRVAVFTGALAIWRLSRRPAYSLQFDRAVFAQVLGFATALFVIFALVGREMLYEAAGALFLTLGIYLFLRLPIGYLLAAGLYASGGFVLTSWLFLAHTPIGLTLIALQLLLANILGAFTARRGQALQRHGWFTLHQLRAREQLDQLVARLSSCFISLAPPELDGGIQAALAEIGQHCDADRAYVFEFDWERQTKSNTYEWCRPGIIPHRHELQNLPVQRMTWESEQLLRGETVRVPRVADLPPEAAAERAEFEREGIRSLVLVPMMLDGRPFGFVGFDTVREEQQWSNDDVALLRIVGEMIVNVLMRKRNDEALRSQTEQLRASNRSLLSSNIGQKSFTRAVSHELQEPLRNVASFSAMLARRYRGRLDADADEYIGFLTSAASRMQKLIEDMSAYALLDHQSHRPGRGDLQTIVRHVLERLQPELNACGAGVRQEPLPAVFGDEHQLEMLFEYLIQNAVKFRDPLRRLEIHITAGRRDSLWEVAVADNGIGVPPEHRRKIFEPFHRLHQWHHLPGSGLGLAACRFIVERHGGSIRVEPNRPYGSRFSFTLPVLQ